MKRKIAILMAGVLTVSTFFGGSVVSRAEDVQEQQNVETVDGISVEENETDDEVIDSDVQDAKEEESGTTEEIKEETTSETTEAATGDAEQSEIKDSQDVETEEDAEEDEDPQKTNNANSWRYQNGENISVYSRARTVNSPNAWKKVNGSFVNSQGTPIAGATKKGMDIGYSQGKINWEKVKNSDIDFVIIECGYGNNQTNQDDKYWEYNVSECERLGIPYGVYLYSYAKNTTMASSEADHVLRLLKGHKPTYPVYLDMEDDSTIKAGKTTLGNIAKTFCDKISNAGYKPGIYANLNWWSNYLTSSVFNNSSWSKWVAQYNITCDYQGTYDIWQSTSVGKVDGVSGNVDLNFWMNGNGPNNNSNNNNNNQKPSTLPEIKVENMLKAKVSDKKIISVTSHQQSYGWIAAMDNGVQSGITGYSKRIEAFKINIPSKYKLGIKYRAHVSGIGWQSWVSTGKVAGTTGQSRAIQAIEVKLTGTNASKYDVYYRVHSQTYGWMGWTKNGEPAGSTGCSKQVEAIQIAVVKKGSAAPGSTSNSFKKNGNVKYRVHQQTYGWLPKVKDGATAGYTGKAKRVEAIEISLENPEYSGNIWYRAHQQSYGWFPWVKNGEEAGITGRAKRMEAIQIKLTGEMAKKYDIYYRVHSQSYGWLGWAKNGQMAGTTGKAKRMESIQIKLVKKGGKAPGSTAKCYVK